MNVFMYLHENFFSYIDIFNETKSNYVYLLKSKKENLFDKYKFHLFLKIKYIKFYNVYL